jgi:tetratricopeptide (TPR) repeat protein
VASKETTTQPEISGTEPEGKKVSVREREMSNTCFQRANEAALKQNYDYAITMYTQCCKLCPDNLLYRQSLHGVLKKKYGDNKKGSRMAAVRVMGPKGKIKRAQLQKNYLQVVDYCEEGLQYNPWDVGLLSDEAEALAKLGYSDIAVFVLTEALQVDSENPAVNRQLGQVYEDMGEFEKAITCWSRVKKAVPADEEADRRVKNLAARETMRVGGLDVSERGEPASETSPTRASARAAQPAPTPEPVSPTAELEARIQADPSEVSNYVRLAEHYRRAKDLAKAQELLKKAVALPGGEQRARDELDGVHLEILRHNLGLAERRLEESPDDPQLQDKVQKAQAQLASYDLNVHRRRYESRPQDVGLRFELAERLFQAGQIDEAIPHFQAVRGDARRGFRALLMLGQCFEAKGNTKLALRNLQDALKAVPAADGEGTKEVHYRLGRLYEKLQQPAEAEEHFNEVAALDYGYRDVAQRLEQLQQ